MLFVIFITIYMIIFVFYCSKSYDNGYKNGFKNGVKGCIGELNKEFANDEDLSNIRIGAKIDGEEV